MQHPLICLLAGGMLILAGCQSGPATPAAAIVATPVAADTTAAAVLAAPTADKPAAAPATADSLAAVRRFVPAGYQVLATLSGDLNRDAYPDRLVALDTLQPDSLRPQSEARRPLLVLTGQPGGGYRLAARNDEAVMCGGCGGMMGDPFQQLVIKNGYFSVEHYGGSSWRWTHIVTFRYDPADRHWYLHRAGGDSFHAADPEKVKTHVETTRDFGRVRFEHYTGNLGQGEGG